MAIFGSSKRRAAGARERTDERDPPAGRLATARERQRPDFVIVGAQRGGTTSLYRYLTEHPDVGSAWRKEVHYFDRFHHRGDDWYLAHFPKRGKFRLVGEASPLYLFHPEVPGRMREALPDVKLIAALREPVARAYSQYEMNRRRGNEELPFAEAVEREDERLEGRGPGDVAFRRFSYLRRGHYAEQLERWFGAFPRERFLIVRSEDLYRSPASVLREAQEFLGLDPGEPREFRPYHLADYSAEMDAATRERLRRHFAPHNRRLRELLGRDFGWGG